MTVSSWSRVANSVGTVPDPLLRIHLLRLAPYPTAHTLPYRICYPAFAYVDIHRQLLITCYLCFSDYNDFTWNKLGTTFNLSWRELVELLWGIAIFISWALAVWSQGK